MCFGWVGGGEMILCIDDIIPGAHPTFLPSLPPFLPAPHSPSHPLSPSLLPLFFAPSLPPASDLFFTSSVPPTINVGTNITAACPIPNIPRSTVTAEETDDITYCNVVSERGVFRSRSVTVTDPTQQGLLAF